MITRARSATPADQEAVIRVLSRTFDREEGSPRFERDRALFCRDPGSYRVLELKGHIVGALHIGRHGIQIGSCVITKADVGEVSILPEYQGKGYGTQLMQETVEWMRQEGFHLSRLGGYVRFYRRFGWVPFPRGFVEFPLAGLRSRGGFTNPEELLKSLCYPGRIRPYNPVTDFGAYNCLHCGFNRNRTGAQPYEASPPRHDPNWQPDPWRVVYEEAGEVLAFLFAGTAPTDHTRFETRVAIQEATVSPEFPTPLGYLLAHILLAAHRYGAPSVSARLPLDPFLYPIYRDYSLGFVPTLWQTTESGNMLRVIDLSGLIEVLLPELQTRVQEAAIPVREGGLRLRVNGHTATLRLRDGMLSQGPGDLPEVELDQELFGFLFLGLQPVFHVVRQLPLRPHMTRSPFWTSCFLPNRRARGFGDRALQGR